MSRKRSAAADPKAPTTERLAELAEDITSDTVVLGPQDVTDIREALCELIQRRNAERFQQTDRPQPKESAA